MLVERLIKENLENQYPILDLGNCGLKGYEESAFEPISQTTHIRSIIFSNKRSEGASEQDVKSLNRLIQIPNNIPVMVFL